MTISREVLVLDDELGVRAGTELLLRDAGLRIVGTAGALGTARGLLRRRRYDVVLLGATVGGAPVSGPDGLIAETLGMRGDAPLVLWLGRDGARAWRTEDDDAIGTGVAPQPPGIVLRASPPARLLEALEVVAGGGRYRDPALIAAESADGAASGGSGPSSPLAALSPREREVLRLLAEGLSGAGIAGRLHLSPETVRTHVRNAVTRLGARTRTQAVAMLVADEAAVGRSPRG